MPSSGLLLGGLAAGAAGGIVGNLTGQGKTDYRAGNFGQSGQYNPNAPNLSIDPRQYGAMGAAAGQRGAIQADGRMGLQDRGMGMQSRQDQQDALYLMKQRAMGLVPSVAQMQGNQALGQALADQQSAVASARGGGGNQALAARSAMLAGAQTRGMIGGQSAMAAAQERNAAEQGYFGGASNIRGMDQSQQGIDNQFAMGQGQLALGSRGQNDALQLGMYGLQNQGSIAEQQGRLQQQGMLAGSFNGQQGINSGINLANAGAQGRNYQGMIGGISGGLMGLGAYGAMGGFGGGGGGGYAGGPGSGLPDPGY